MKRFLLWLFVFASLSLFAEEHKLQSFTLAKTYEKAELEAFWKEKNIPKFISPVSNGVDVYEVIYKTTRPDGSPTIASGLYYVPKKKDAVPTIVYHHGTTIKKERQVKLGGEQAICMAFAADGYAVLRPDYLGLGKGEGLHLYVHAESEAMASIDMLRAIEEFNKEQGIKTTDQLFLTGYSQGGHAAMATHMYIQQLYSDEFNVTAASPMSGPYDISGVQGEVMFEPYSHPGYLPYLLYGYNEVYNMFDNVNSIFKAPYDSILPPLYDGTHTFGDINHLMPAVPHQIIKDEIIQAFLNDPELPLHKALEDNDVYDWKPEKPTMICYCKADEQVSYKNALVTYNKMKDNGAENVKLMNAGNAFDHGTCALYTSIYTKMWFDSFVAGSKKGKKGPAFKRFLVNLSKGPAKKAMRKSQKRHAEKEAQLRANVQ